MQKKQKKAQVERIAKPFLRGKMIDRGFVGGALKFFGFTALMAFVYFMSMIVSGGARWVSMLINGAILFVTWLIMWQSGAGSGADAVTQGEIMYQRREKERPVADWELEQCYHPLKGLMVALAGSLPLFLCCLVLALIADRQMTAMGILPEWVEHMLHRPDIGGGMLAYQQEATVSLEMVLRVIVHIVLAPWVGLVDASNKDAILVLERLAPVLALVPALAYGVGYTFGKKERELVHGNIALGKKKQQKKQRRERRARRTAARGPEQLN